jgi:hypothetical protein
MFTKGWNLQGLVIVDDNNILIADARMHGGTELFGDNHGRPFKETTANANLISASPDIYEALKALRIITDLCFDDIKAHGNISIVHARDYRKTRLQADNALAKADGK